MGSLSSRVLRHPGRARAQQEPGSRAGGSARRPETERDAAGHGFCYCAGKRKRNSGAFCHCHSDSETDENEEEGDEQQRLLNTPRRYVRHAPTPSAPEPVGRAGAGCAWGCGASQPPRSGRALDGNVRAGPGQGR